MSLADLDTRDRTTRCSVGLALRDLQDDDADTLQKWLDSIDYSARKISEMMAQYGSPISTQQVGRHRRHECGCW